MGIKYKNNVKQHFTVVLIAIVCLECVFMVSIGRIVYQRMANKNVLGVTRVVPIKKENLLFSPEVHLKYFYEPKPENVVTDDPDWLPQPVTYTINADSLNDRYSYTTGKPSDVFRIITLGDSFTYGQYVNTKDAWPEQLEDMLNSRSCSKDKKFQVLNLGVYGYDVQYIAHRYALRGVKYHPDLIIWFESGTGFDRTIELMREYIDMYDEKLTDAARKAYKAKGNYTPSWSLAIDEVRRAYGEERISKLVGSWWSDFFQIRGNTPLLLMTFTGISSQEKARLQSWTKGQPNVSISSSISPFDGDGNLPDGHPNVYGHYVLARDTLAYLTQSRLIPCD